MTIDIGTAGSTTLVIQTILVPVLATGRRLRATIIGGTHNPMAPPFEFLERVFLPHLRKMGGHVTLTLEKHGLMPNGGGRIVLETSPSKLVPIDVLEGGRLIARRATAICARIPRQVGDRELAVVQERLDNPVCDLIEMSDAGPHNTLMIEVERASGARELVTNHGRKGYPAEHVAEDALAELPERIRKLLENVPIVASDYPSIEIVAEGNDPRMLGFFSGVPYPEKSSLGGVPHLDCVFLYQQNIERMCRGRAEATKEVRTTLLHETGHFFGMSEDDLSAVGLE